MNEVLKELWKETAHNISINVITHESPRGYKQRYVLEALEPIFTLLEERQKEIENLRKQLADRDSMC